jgi:uncharacterized damage-inducible protein DinB
MTATSRTTLKIVEFDVKRSLLETFAINERANQKLIESLSDAAWHASPPGGKGRSIAGIACHVHNVRLMWLGAADKSAKLSAKTGRRKGFSQKRDGSTQREREARAGVVGEGVARPSGEIPEL